MSDDERADARMEHIVSAIKDKDGDALRSLFSKKALEEATCFERDLDYLFEFLQDTIVSYKIERGTGRETILYGKKTTMLCYSIYVSTDKEIYILFVIDYVTDTIDPDNEGVYMLEVCLVDSPNTGAWQERMRAGLYLH